jgi:hypothetical protein
VERLSAACGPSASARVASTSRVDRPWTNPAITNASSALVRVTWAPSSWEAKRCAVPRSFGRSKDSGPLVVLTVIGWWPLREPGSAAGTRWSRSRPPGTRSPRPPTPTATAAGRPGGRPPRRRHRGHAMGRRTAGRSRRGCARQAMLVAARAWVSLLSGELIGNLRPSSFSTEAETRPGCGDRHACSTAHAR